MEKYLNTKYHSITRNINLGRTCECLVPKHCVTLIDLLKLVAIKLDLPVVEVVAPWEDPTSTEACFSLAEHLLGGT